MKIENRRGTFNEFFTSYSGPRATSVTPALAILFFLSLGTLFTDFGGESSQFNFWAIVAGESFGLSFGYFVLIGQIIKRWVPPNSVWRNFAITFLFFSTEMFRAIFVARGELELGISQAIDWDYRVVAGGLTGVLFLGFFSVINNDSATYKEKLTELNQIQNKLKETTKITSNDLTSIRNNAINVIRQEINKSLSSLLSQSQTDNKNAQIVVQELVRISDDVVRPMSHDIFQSGNERNLIENKPRLFSPRLVELASLNPFFPNVTTFFAGIQIVGLAIFGVENQLAGFTSLVTYLLWIYLTLSLANKFLKPYFSSIKIYLRIFLASLTYVLLALCPFVFTFVSQTLRIPQNWNFAIYLSLIALIMLWPISFYAALRVARAEVLTNIETTNEQLSWSAARLGAQLWTEKQRFAHLVHKNIQGALISSALKLKNDLDTGQDTKDSLKKIRALVQDSSDFLFNSENQLSVLDQVKSLNTLWDGIFFIELNLKTDAAAKLAQDTVAQNSVNDLLNEFVTNSVKHGKAKTGEVSFELISESVLQVSAKNDGLPLPETMTHGLGSQMALEQCISVSQKNLVPQGVEFTFTLPIK